MKKLIFSLFTAITALSAHGQDIHGYVYSLDNNEPVEFANVVLMKLPDSSFVKGIITYMDGDYSFENVAPGNYVVKSSFVGYTDGIASIAVTGEKSSFMADTIFLSEKTNELDEVTVTADMVRGEEMVDRTVYSITPDVAKTSVNGYDILRKIPSVQVDFNNKITLDGKTNFIVTVDGKERDAEFLARLLPEDIKSIEIIHNPSGKYDGTIDGVINVKLYPNARMGVSGNMVLAAKPFNKPTLFGNAGLDLGLKNITFYASGFTVKQVLDSKSTSTYNYMNTESRDSVLQMVGAGDFDVSVSSFNTGFDYYMNDMNTVSVNYTYKPNSIFTSINSEGDILLDDVVGYRQSAGSETTTGSDESNVSLFYRKEFQKPIQELTFETRYYTFNSQDNNNYSNSLFDADGNSIFSAVPRTEVVINDRNYFKNSLDYVQPVGTKMRVEGGAQL